jgi:hypothetical protein
MLIFKVFPPYQPFSPPLVEEALLLNIYIVLERTKIVVMDLEI